MLTITAITSIEQEPPAPDMAAPAAALARLLQLASPALPVGAYAYSEGLEYAVECAWVDDTGSARDWILGVLEHGFARLDVAVLGRMMAAWAQSDVAAVERWSTWLLACRETRELRETDAHLGRALARVLAGLGVDGAAAWTRHPRASFAASFALAAVRWRLPDRDAAVAFAWAWVENMVAAAIKLVPLGQSDGQRILFEAGGRLDALCVTGLALEDDDLGTSLPGLVIASSLHETQTTRLFRS